MYCVYEVVYKLSILNFFFYILIIRVKYMINIIIIRGQNYNIILCINAIWNLKYTIIHIYIIYIKVYDYELQISRCEYQLLS